MAKEFKIYWVCVFCKGFAGVYIIINYIFGINFVYLFKVPLIISTLALLTFHIKRKFYLGFIAKFFLFFSLLGFFVSIFYGNPISEKTLSHLYTIFISVFGVSFGYYFAKFYDHKIDSFVRKCVKILFYISLINLIFYFYFHYSTGQIQYFGFDTELPTSFVFFASNGDVIYLLATVLLILFSGKRSPLISIFPVAIIYFIKNFNIKKKNSLILLILVVSIISASFYILNKNDFFWRFESVLNVDISDEHVFYIATSGRSAEFEGILRHMNSDPKRWIIGSGIGGSYFIDIVRGDAVERNQHYAHLSLLSLTFLFGLPFTIIFIFYVISVIIKNFKYYNNKYYLGMIVFFTASLFGAGIIVDSIFWVFLGVNSYISVANSDSQILSLK